jgi:hypothetical protein
VSKESKASKTKKAFLAGKKQREERNRLRKTG